MLNVNGGKEDKMVRAWLFRSMVGCMLVTLAVNATAVEPGLVGHWDFDEGQGEILHDRSGHGNDGRISGGARWVEGVRGKALEFNGTDAMVEVKKSPSLNLKGDATVLVWMKTEPDDGRDRIIFGDGAGLSVNRNINIELDRGSLFIEHGTGQGSENLPTPRIPLDNTWAHIAIVMEPPRYYLYHNGKLAGSGEMLYPITPTDGGNRYIGGWWAGKFRGAIDDLKVYGRALSEAEVLSHYEGKPVSPQPALDVEPRVRLAPRRLDVSVSARNLVGQNWVAEVVLFDANGSKIEQSAATLVSSRPASQRAFGTCTVPIETLRPGRYSLLATVKDERGETAISEKADLDIPPTPEWLGSTAGVTDAVLPPFVPVESVRAGVALRCKVIGREYEFGQGGVLDQVTAAGTQLLSEPVQVTANMDGKKTTFEWAAPQQSVATPARVEVRQSASAGDAALQLNTALEYDGLARTTLELRPMRPAHLFQMRLEFPLKTDHAILWYTWPTTWGRSGFSGFVGNEQAVAFYPIVWVGDDERGISVFWESDEGWRLSNPKRAIELVRRDRDTLLRFNLVTQATEVSPDKPLRFSFGYQATPVKPIAQTCWDYRIFSSMEYGYDYGITSRKVGDLVELDYVKAKGGRTLLLGNWTDALTYPWPIGHEEDLRNLVKAVHERQMRVIVYLGFQISERAPEYALVRDEVRRKPIISGPDRYPGMEPQIVDTVCLRSYWQDSLAHHVAKLLEEYDLDGVYLDSTAMPFDCRNELHGCGYHRPDGTIGETYPVWAVRDTFKRLYALVKSHRPDGIVDAHVYDCMNSAALSFATSYWNGEQLSQADHVLDALPLDRFRAEMCGRNWGVPAEFLHYRLGNFRNAHSIALLHDVPVRMWLSDRDLTAAIWGVFDDFGRTGWEFLPYWSNSAYVTVTPERCYASLYLRGDKALLAIVSNLSKVQATVSVRLNLSALGLQGRELTARDAMGGADIRVADGAFDIVLPPMGWQYVRIQPVP